MEEHPIQGFFMIIALVALNAIVSGAESAIKNVNESNAVKRAEEGDKRAERLVKLLDTPYRYINVIEILITLSSLLIGMAYSFFQYTRIEEWVENNLGYYNVAAGKQIAMVITTIVITYLVVLFGILLPKKVALKYADRFAYVLTDVIMFFGRLFTPFLWLLEKNTNLLLRIIHINPQELEENVTEEEIMSILNEGQEQGVIEAEEAEMISNIISFDAKTAGDVMTHRKNIVAINSELTIEEALHSMLNENFSRFPIYEGNIDNIIGVLHLKDVITYYLDPKLRRKALSDVAREPYFIPDTKGIDVLFHDMQSKKIHIAVAIDEYGQTAGLVAMEDILEEIVGEIMDEYDEDVETITEQEDGSFMIRGSASLEELEDVIKLRIEKEDMENYDTINGLMISLLDHIPDGEEKESVSYGGYQLTIVEVGNKIIQWIRAEKLPEESEETMAEEQDTENDIKENEE